MNVSDTSAAKTDTFLLLPSNCSNGLCTNSTKPATTSNYKLLLPIGVIIVIVLAAACLLLGVVYGYVYFTRESGKTTNKPRNKSVSSRQQPGDHYHPSGGANDPANDCDYTTHMFLFRKHYSVHPSAT